MIDLKTRKPADLLTLHGGSIVDYICQKECPIEKPGRIKVASVEPVGEYVAKYSDIDCNGHVNSIKYIEHILDLFHMDVFREKMIHRFEGDKLTFYREQISDNEYDIEVKKNDSEVVVRSKVIFR